jgi:hypothetical protein
MTRFLPPVTAVLAVAGLVTSDDAGTDVKNLSGTCRRGEAACDRNRLGLQMEASEDATSLL